MSVCLFVPQAPSGRCFGVPYSLCLLGVRGELSLSDLRGAKGSPEQSQNPLASSAFSVKILFVSGANRTGHCSPVLGLAALVLFSAHSGTPLSALTTSHWRHLFNKQAGLGLGWLHSRLSRGHLGAWRFLDWSLTGALWPSGRREARSSLGMSGHLLGPRFVWAVYC